MTPERQTFLVSAGRGAGALVLTYANHLGLYAEEISRTGEQQGTSPRRSPTWR
jgi:hypothetical protein